MMLFHTVLFVVISSMFAAPQYYYSNFNQDLSPRLGRSTYKKCPNGFLMNAVNECVQPEIETFYFLFETPKVPIIQSKYSNHLVGNVYVSSPATKPPYFFLVQPKVPHIPNSGVLPITSYPSGQYQVPNSLFFQHANVNLQKNSFTNNNLKQSSLLPLRPYSQDDSISDSSHENELSFDYSRQYQPSSEYQQLIQNPLQESRKEIDNSVTRITSFHHPSGIFHPSSTTGNRTVQTSRKQLNKNAEISSVSAGEIKSAGDIDKESVLSTFGQQPSPALTHIDGGINSLPVEETLTVSSAYKGRAANLFTLPGTKQQPNSVSSDTLNKVTVNSIPSAVNIFYSSSDNTAIEQFASHTNKDVDPVIVNDTESAEDLIDLRIDNDESAIYQQPSPALSHIDGGTNSSPVEQELSISSAYKGGATNFFTLPGISKQSNEASITTFNKATDNNLQSPVGTFHNSDDNTAILPVEMHSNENLEPAITADTESTKGLIDLRIGNDESAIDQRHSPALSYIDRGINSFLGEEELPISSTYKGGATNFFTIPGTRKQSGSDSRATVGTIHSTNDDTETEPLIVDDVESTEDSFDLISGDENSSDEDGGDDDIASTGTIDRSPTYQDQAVQESVAIKNTANVYFIQSELTGESPAFRASSAQSQGNTNLKNNELLGKAATEKSSKFSFGNLILNDGGIQLNKMFDHIRANLTSGTVKPDSYKGFVYIAADEGKEIIYEF